MAPAPAGDAHECVSVLLIDDDRGVRTLARIYAEGAGCDDVVEVDDGLTAVREVAARPFDLVVVDYHMPGMSGLETAAKLLNLRPGLRIVAWTSAPDPRVEEAFLAAGVARHIPKLDTETLREELASSCGLQAA